MPSGKKPAKEKQLYLKKGWDDLRVEDTEAPARHCWGRASRRILKRKKRNRNLEWKTFVRPREKRRGEFSL